MDRRGQAISTKLAIAVQNRPWSRRPRHGRAVDIVPNHTGHDRPCGKRRHTDRTALDKPIDSEPRTGPLVSAEEDGIAGCPSLHQLRKHTFGTRPQWTLTQLPALAVDGRAKASR